MDTFWVVYVFISATCCADYIFAKPALSLDSCHNSSLKNASYG